MSEEIDETPDGEEAFEQAGEDFSFEPSEPEAVEELESVDEPEAVEESEAEAIDEPEAEEPEAVEAPSDTSQFSAAATLSKKKKKGHALRNTLITIVVILVLAVGGFCGYMIYDDSQRTQHAPEDTTLDGKTDISGMTVDQIKAAATKDAKEGLVKGITIGVGDDFFDIELDKVGEPDPDATADAVLSLYGDNLFERCIDSFKQKFMGEQPKAHDVTTAIALDHNKLASAIQTLADEEDCDPTNAGYAYDKATNSLVMTEAKKGFKLDVDATVAAVEKAEADGSLFTKSCVDAVAEITEPEVTEATKAIFVDCTACRTYLYENGVVVKTYLNTPGASGYATPKGDFYISQKDPSPTWYNPHSSWSEGMAETIAPGASNPLGLRALAVSCGGGIYLHGTTNTGQLGYPGSHGCVRHSNADICELYDLVDVGTPVIIR